MALTRNQHHLIFDEFFDEFLDEFFDEFFWRICWQIFWRIFWRFFWQFFWRFFFLLFTGNIDLGNSSNSGSGTNQKSASFDLWKMDSLMDSGYINTYYRAGGSNPNGSTNYPSLQAFPSSSQAGQAQTSCTTTGILNQEPHYFK